MINIFLKLTPAFYSKLAKELKKQTNKQQTNKTKQKIKTKTNKQTKNTKKLGQAVLELLIKAVNLQI